MPLSPRRESRIGPHLRGGAYTVTSPEDGAYNCIAFAYGSTIRWMWPAEEDAAWPAGVLNDESVSAFIALFESIGYEVCGTADFDAGFLKVALYADAHGIPTHAAVQREDGSWASKLGAWEDISHRHPATVGGGLYGEPVVFLRRPVSA